MLQIPEHPNFYLVVTKYNFTDVNINKPLSLYHCWLVFPTTDSYKYIVNKKYRKKLKEYYPNAILILKIPYNNVEYVDLYTKCTHTNHKHRPLLCNFQYVNNEFRLRMNLNMVSSNVAQKFIQLLNVCGIKND